jgi:hypothetical protein
MAAFGVKAACCAGTGEGVAVAVGTLTAARVAFPARREGDVTGAGAASGCGASG